MGLPVGNPSVLWDERVTGKSTKIIWFGFKGWSPNSTYKYKSHNKKPMVGYLSCVHPCSSSSFPLCWSSSTSLVGYLSCVNQRAALLQGRVSRGRPQPIISDLAADRPAGWSLLRIWSSLGIWSFLGIWSSLEIWSSGNLIVLGIWSFLGIWSSLGIWYLGSLWSETLQLIWEEFAQNLTVPGNMIISDNQTI